jgi:chromosome segregation ATPase
MTDIAKDQRPALQESSESVRQRESEGARDLMPTKPDDCNGKGLAVTIERLRLVKEVVAMRRRIDQSKDPAKEAGGQARKLEHELEKSQAKLRESEDERRTMEIGFTEHLRHSSAELESSRAQVEALKLDCSRATSLSTALQDRIYELEAQATARRSTRNCHSTTAINANSSSDAPEASGHPHAHGQADPSTAIGNFHLQFSTYYD